MEIRKYVSTETLITVPSLLLIFIGAGSYVFHKHSLSQIEREFVHQSLPAIIRPYDLNKDGVLQKGELETFIKDHPELKSFAHSP
jgi:hypothetical protein